MLLTLSESKIHVCIVVTIIMSDQKIVPNPQESRNPEEDSSQLSPEILDKIKHPARIDDVMRDLPPEELRSNPAVTPERLDDPSGE